MMKRITTKGYFPLTTIVSLLPLVASTNGRLGMAGPLINEQRGMLKSRSSRTSRFLPSKHYYDDYYSYDDDYYYDDDDESLQRNDHLKDHRDDDEENTVGSPTQEPTKSPKGPPVRTSAPSFAPTKAPTTTPTKAPVTTPVIDDCLRLDSVLFEEFDQVEVNLSGNQDSPGDIWVFDSNAVTTEGYASGVSAGRCIMLEDVDLLNNLYCTMTVEFPEGSVIFSGVFADGLAVVGGTGCYAGLTGTVDLGSNEDEDEFTYTVTPANAPSTCDLSMYESPWNMEGGYTLVDWDGNGPSSGDSFVFERREVITSGGEQGFADGECLVLEDTRDEKPFCSITFDFGDDKVFVMGVFDDMIITAGLGCFLGASGKISGQTGPGANEFMVTFDDPTSTEDDNCREGVFDNTWIEEFGETFVDYPGSGTSSGDAYVFENKLVVVPTTNGEISATSTGRCAFLQDFGDTFCNLVLTLPEGSIVLSGFFSKMFVVAGSECFRGLTGTILGGDNDQGLTYDFDVAYITPDSPPVQPTTAPFSVPTLAPINQDSPTDNPTEAPTRSPSLEPTVECGRLLAPIVELQNGDSELDVLPDGFSAGDTYLFESNILETTGYENGESAGRCVTLETTEEYNNVYCSIVFEFPEGVVVLQGVFNAINAISGIGCYRSITAQVVLSENSDGFSYDFTPVNNKPPNCPIGIFQGQWTEPGGHTVVDWDQNDLSPGDIIVFDKQELNIPAGWSGSLEGECSILVEVSVDKAFCSVTFNVDGDRMHAMGVFDNMVITGGTGCFFEISGIISGRTLGNGSKQFDLITDAEDSNEDSSCPDNSLFDTAWIEEPGEELIDYDESGESSGDAYVFDNKSVSMPTGSQAASAGRCVFLQDMSRTFCSITLRTSQGSIALQGFFTSLYIVGGTGCFRGLAGRVLGGEEEGGGFTYEFDIE